MKKLLIVLLLLMPTLLKAENCMVWPEWQTFKNNFISKEGRVIDLGSEKNITTSEGQSYGLFFALVANDKETFDKLLNWTERHLAEGDLSARLPAWLWGRKTPSSYGILDSNPASDSDLWIAYALAEASRLWNERRYAVLAAVMAKRILKEETEFLPGLGLTLLPAPYGFEVGEQTWRLNPSYLPPFIFQRFVELYPSQPWQEVLNSSLVVLSESAPKGFSPDWVLYNPKKGFHFTKRHNDEGNFNAIRSYLWVGLLADDVSYKEQLLFKFDPMARKVSANRAVPLNTYAKTGRTAKTGPLGFQAAILPFMKSFGDRVTASMINQKINANIDYELRNNYYSSVLTLFGTAATNARFEFLNDGSLVPAWSTECN
ncbi:cellulose synthase complex periplasmic endoglucanase BcsZ [Pseudoalteromonas spongiae]|uniref:cellulose synthase complex periplasmic endoglucanase BcsZ n=1 Tax=Pseudoalteromonas spongiae TaxID=298657 RepID=UPI00026CCDC0|nr:cellulose synthase complex periplasmic endoglucanase BcsZ [Pseudoalteromonas spongiae]ATC98253.1 endoglucanase [Pseudoalteromonas spongiae UST010723-006]